MVTMEWSLERKAKAALCAPMGPGILREDTRTILHEGWYQIITPSAKLAMNEVCFSQVDDRDAEHVIDETWAMYRALGLQTKWYVTPWTQPANFGERLGARGFSSTRLRAMGAGTQLQIDVPAGVDVTEVTDASALHEFLDVTSRGWNIRKDEYAALLASHETALTEEPRVAHLFIARIAGEAVGTAALFVRGDYGYFVGGQVLASARGKGAYKALARARLRFLRDRGIDYAVTHASEETAAPLLERMGFETLYQTRCYVLTP